MSIYLKNSYKSLEDNKKFEFYENVYELNVYQRVHINSLNLSGLGSMVSGGIGFPFLAKQITISVCMTIGNKNELLGIDSSRFESILNVAKKDKKKLEHSWKIKIENPLNNHIGLGSTTQIEAGLLYILFEIIHNQIPQLSDFQDAGIANESIVGLKCFLYKGFIIDPGYWNDPDKDYPNYTSSISYYSVDFPKEWKPLIVIPKSRQSISGQKEKRFWNKVIPTPKNESEKICFNVLMGLIPAIAERDFKVFLSSLSKIQSFGSKPAEIQLNRKRTKELILDLNKEFGFGGLSSLGPTCFAFIEDSSLYSKKIEMLQNKYLDYDFNLTQVVQ